MRRVEKNLKLYRRWQFDIFGLPMETIFDYFTMYKSSSNYDSILWIEKILQIGYNFMKIKDDDFLK